MAQHPSSPAKFVTSIVPALRRIDRHGQDIGAAYQEQCIETWLSTGADVISVNTLDEAPRLKSSPISEKVTCVFTDRAEGIYPDRYGPTLGAVFGFTSGAGTAGFFNADTFIPDIDDFHAFICAEAQDRFIVARRTDVEAAGGRFLGINGRGIDAIFFDRSRFAPVFEAPELRNFQLGVPWWDLIIPVAASFYGPLAQLPEPFLLHMDHTKAWNGENYRRAGDLGRKALLALAIRASAFSDEAGQFASEFAALQETIKKYRLSKQLFECNQFYFDWVWKRAGKRIIEPRGYLTSSLMRSSMAATLQHREPPGFQLAKLQSSAPGPVIGALGADLAHALKLTGRHLERWSRHKIRGKTIPSGKSVTGISRLEPVPPRAG